MEKHPVEIKSLKKGGFVLIDSAPCAVVSIDISKPGKHGAAKARVAAIGVFDGVKRVVVKPGSSRVDVPVIEKRSAQVVSKSGDTMQIMDMQDYSMKEVRKPDFEVSEGDELLIWKYGDNILIKGKK